MVVLLLHPRSHHNLYLILELFDLLRRLSRVVSYIVLVGFD